MDPGDEIEVILDPRPGVEAGTGAGTDGPDIDSANTLSPRRQSGLSPIAAGLGLVIAGLVLVVVLVGPDNEVEVPESSTTSTPAPTTTSPLSEPGDATDAWRDIVRLTIEPGSFDPIRNPGWRPAASHRGSTPLPPAIWTGRDFLALDTVNAGDDVSGMTIDPDTGIGSIIAPSQATWRDNAAIAWTGKNLLIVGGSSGPALEPFAILYNPSADHWEPFPGPDWFGDPPPNADQGAPLSPIPIVLGPGVWDGQELLIWRAGLVYRDGGPTNSWGRIADHPDGDRSEAVTVWTGTELIVLGGCVADPRLRDCDDSVADARDADAHRYVPDLDRWLPTADPPFPLRHGLVADWAGDEMLVLDTSTGQAAAYDPVDDIWRTLASPSSVLAPRIHSASVMVDDRWLVHGGSVDAGGVINNFADGAVYDPALDQWQNLPATPDLVPRSRHSLTAGPPGIVLVSPGLLAPDSYLLDLDAALADDGP